MDDPLHIRPVKTDGRSSSTASSRAAANLSLERLYRKRAIDRENQRVLRQKNKARLAELETEVRSLTARLEQSEADKALQAVRSQSSSTSLEHIIASLQSLQVSLGQLGAASGSESGTTTPGSSPVASASSVVSGASAVSRASRTSGAASAATGIRIPSLSPLSPSPASHHSDSSTATRVGSVQDQSMGGTILSIPEFWGPGVSVTVPVDDSTPRNSEFSVDIDLLTRHQPLLSPDLPPEVQDGRYRSPTSPTRPSAAYTFRRHNSHDDNNNINNDTKATAAAAVYQAARVEANRLRDTSSPIWAVTPAYVPPTSSVDELIVNLVYRTGVGGGSSSVPADLGPRTLPPIQVGDGFLPTSFPSVHSLLNPARHEANKPVAPLSSLLSSTIARQIATTITAYKTPERSALLYIMCIYIRWLSSPTKEHFDCIPDFFRPTASQLVVPHPFWIDTLGWPHARERLIRHLDHTLYRDFSNLFTKSFSIGWPRHALDGILETSYQGSPEKGFVMTRAFIQHVRNPANWTVGIELVEAFPFLEGAVNVRGHPPVSLR